MDFEDKSERTERFLNLMMSNQDRIRSYIAVLVPNRADADDIMQDAATIMWRKFDDFRSGSDFAAWGVRIAYYRILYYRRNKKNNAVQLSEELFDKLSYHAEKKTQQSDDHLECLRKCVEKLDVPERELLKSRYDSGQTPKALADKTGRSLTAIYRAFARIYDKLARCVRRTIAQEASQ
ncbi:MAG: sigma-70 family RNA polymerase sigma factor [Anaerohalosphaera sp.]|nr:sigma-70 family RNA polymerase sigma factor [Anaerohalosphaera sp.]